MLIIMCSLIGLQAQHPSGVNYPQLDAHLVSIWIQAEKNDISKLVAVYPTLQTEWNHVKSNLLTKEIRHLNLSQLVADLDLEIAQMGAHINKEHFDALVRATKSILYSFKETRQFYTGEKSALDDFLSTWQIYEELHYAVDDEMLGLYEWDEFNQLFLDFQEHFKEYVHTATPAFEGESKLLFDLCVRRVEECMEEFAHTLATAQQNQFEAPCDDTRDALMDILSLYQYPSSSMQ